MRRPPGTPMSEPPVEVLELEMWFCPECSEHWRDAAQQALWTTTQERFPGATLTCILQDPF